MSRRLDATCAQWFAAAVAVVAMAGCGGGRKGLPKAPAALGGAGANTTPKAQQGQIIVVMRGFRNQEGDAKVALYRDPDAFPQDNSRAHARIAVPIQNGSAVAVFDKVPPGAFAVAMLHDEDGDSAMKTGFLGRPKEGFGISRNPTIGFSPPSWKESAMMLPADRGAVVLVRLRYM